VAIANLKLLLVNGQFAIDVLQSTWGACYAAKRTVLWNPDTRFALLGKPNRIVLVGAYSSGWSASQRFHSWAAVANNLAPGKDTDQVEGFKAKRIDGPPLRFGPSYGLLWPQDEQRGV